MRAPPRLLGDFLAAALSLLLALFGVFQILFTDVFGLAERVQSWLYVGGLYSAAGFILTLFWPPHVTRWRLWLGVSAAIVTARFIIAEPGRTLWDLAGLAAALLGLFAGTAAGRRLRRQP